MSRARLGQRTKGCILTAGVSQANTVNTSGLFFIPVCLPFSVALWQLSCDPFGLMCTYKTRITEAAGAS
jgi:hypothetical protein